VKERDYFPFQYVLEDLKGKCGVYQIRNIVNDYVYIGSSNNIKYRLETHFKDLEHNKHLNHHLQHAYNKYGKENFIFEIVEFCSLSEQFKTEQYWLDRFFGKTNCYNLNPFASKPPSNKGKKIIFSEEHRKNISKAQKERYKNPEVRKRMSELRKGKNLGADHVNSKAVVCLETGIEYGSIMEAVRNTPCNKDAISNCCKGIGKNSCGLHWKFKDDYLKMTKTEIEDTIFINTIGKQVVCLETGKKYARVIDAASDTGIIRDSIIDCCEHRLNETFGTHWVYYSEYINLTTSDIQLILNKHSIAFSRCICVETGEIFAKISEAARKMNLSQSKISLVCSGKRKSTGGYHFKYVD